jgi:hypothetical protein
MTRSGFAGFPPEAIGFFRGLARNNRREWFQPRKAVFETSVKQPMRELVTALNQALAGFAPEYATDPEKAIFRIYRDVRFSKDKKPYKEHIAANFDVRGMGRMARRLLLRHLAQGSRGGRRRVHAGTGNAAGHSQPHRGASRGAAPHFGQRESAAPAGRDCRATN